MRLCYYCWAGSFKMCVSVSHAAAVLCQLSNKLETVVNRASKEEKRSRKKKSISGPHNHHKFNNNNITFLFSATRRIFFFLSRYQHSKPDERARSNIEPGIRKKKNFRFRLAANPLSYEILCTHFKYFFFAIAQLFFQL